MNTRHVISLLEKKSKNAKERQVYPSVEKEKNIPMKYFDLYGDCAKEMYKREIFDRLVNDSYEKLESLGYIVERHLEKHHSYHTEKSREEGQVGAAKASSF